MAAKSQVDWEAIEPFWRAGIKSVTQIATEYTETTGISVSHTAINKHFKKLGVPRDLDAKVQAKAKAMVSNAMVSGKVSTETTATDAQIIVAAATEVATVRLSHRKDINKSRVLVRSLLEEIERQTDSPDLFDKLAALVADAPDDESKEDAAARKALQDSFYKVVSLSGRVDNVKKLVDAMKTLVGLERQAFGILDEEAPPPPPMTPEQRIARIRVLAAKAKQKDAEAAGEA